MAEVLVVENEGAQEVVDHKQRPPNTAASPPHRIRSEDDIAIPFLAALSIKQFCYPSKSGAPALRLYSPNFRKRSYRKPQGALLFSEGHHSSPIMHRFGSIDSIHLNCLRTGLFEAHHVLVGGHA